MRNYWLDTCMVYDNRDPLKMGRVLTKKGWLSPISHGFGEYCIPNVGRRVYFCGGCYYIAIAY